MQKYRGFTLIEYHNSPGTTSLFYKWGNGDSERGSDLLKVSQLLNSKNHSSNQQIFIDHKYLLITYHAPDLLGSIGIPQGRGQQTVAPLFLQIKFYRHTALLIGFCIVCDCVAGAPLNSYNRDYVSWEGWAQSWVLTTYKVIYHISKLPPSSLEDPRTLGSAGQAFRLLSPP